MPTENQQQSAAAEAMSDKSGTLYQDQGVDSEKETELVRQETLKKVKEEEKVLFSWTAPSRPFKPRSRDYYVKLVSMAILFGVVLFIIDGIMPVLMIVALLFLFYVLSTVKPEDIEYKITNKGIYIGNNRTDWDMLGRFWFINRLGADMLAIEAANITGRLEIMVPDEHKDKVEQAVGKYLDHESVPPTLFDKAARWASDHLPLE